MDMLQLLCTHCYIVTMSVTLKEMLQTLTVRGLGVRKKAMQLPPHITIYITTCFFIYSEGPSG